MSQIGAQTVSEARAVSEGHYAPDYLPAQKPNDRRLRLALHMASLIRRGTLTIVFPDGSNHRVSASAQPEATVIVRDARMITRLMTGGNVGLAEAYLDGLWESPDIRAVMELAAVNEAELQDMLKGSLWVRALWRLLHRMRPNSRSGARRNIVEHYDLGNDFYAEWLDPGMTYSSALFDRPGQTLQEAQESKMRRLCEGLDLRPGMSVLEIGFGWGGFAELAAREFGVHVTGVTLSPLQLDHARQRIARAGLSDRVELRLQDYREITGQFDRIASIEMFEAVGRKYWPVFFSTLRDRLTPTGIAGLQLITIEDRLFADYCASPDFIQLHVFPGGMLPCPARLHEEIARAGLSARAQHWFGHDYARTLAEWQRRFQDAWPAIARLSSRYDARFKRLWEYYLAYCETGFAAGWTDVGQIFLTRPALV